MRPVSLGDPAEIIVRNCLLSRHIASKLLRGQVQVHVTSRVHSCDELDDAAQERVATPTKRLEGNLLTSECGDNLTQEKGKLK